MHYAFPRVLVTGAAGFIGSHLCEHLLARGAQVVALDNLSTGNPDNLADCRDRIEFIEGTIADEPLVDSLVSQSAAVVHLAASVGNRVVSRQPLKSIQNNIRGTSVVLAACAKYHRPVLIASSSEVYGRCPTLPFVESADVVIGNSSSPRWLYGASKLANEFEAFAYARDAGLQTVAARFFNIAGPRQAGRYGMILPRFVRQALLGEDITIYGDGEQIRCFCHVSTLCDAVLDLLACPAAYGQVVNLGSSSPVTLRELAERVKARTGSSSRITYTPFEAVYGTDYEDMARRRPDTSKAHALIGFETRYTLDSIIDDIADWMRAHWERIVAERDY